MRIAHLSAEVSPFARSGGLGDVAGALPAALAELGHEITVWMPFYRQVREALPKLGLRVEAASPPFMLELGFERHEIALLRGALPGSAVPVYFVANDRYFDRPHLYHADSSGRDDGLSRFSLFVRAALEGLARIGAIPDVLHSHDWHTGLCPMALAWDRPPDRRFAACRTVHTLHNLAFQGSYDRREFPRLGLPETAIGGVEWSDSLNLLKGALVAADEITAVSPTFAWEITTPEGGFGLDPIIRDRVHHLSGIVNGIDRGLWNPDSDPKIPFRYRLDDLAGKRENRRTLLTMAGFDTGDPGLVVGLIGRLSSQKGYDLLFPVLDELLAEGIRVVALGSGEPEIEAQVRAYTQRAKGRFWAYVDFDDTLAHLIHAGADAFLMPSRFEPCGLGQLYALAYGTPPIVRRVGGLADTVVGYDGHNAGQATGFAFGPSDPAALRDAVRRAAQCHRDSTLWSRLVRNGMSQDFSWRRSARRYVDVYERLASAPPRRNA